MAGAQVLITRSQPGASALASALEAAGYACDVAPIIEIERVGAGADDLRALADRQVVVFTSAHAVEHAFALIECSRSRLPTDAEWIAIGAATAKALARHRIEASIPESASSEGLLAMSQLAHVEGRRVMIVGGVGGRRTLDDALRERGARLVRATVYRRRAAAERAGLSFLSGALAAVVVSSAEAGRALERALRERAPTDANAATVAARMAELPVIVPSARVALALAKLGFRRTIVGDGASAAAVIGALREAAVGSSA